MVEPARRRPPPLRIAVVGGGECDDAVGALAEAVGQRVAQAGALLLCGGLGGVMAAAARGADGAGGTVLGILPGYDAAAANPWVHIPLPSGLGHARNVLVVAGADAVIALPGAAGTRSEIAFAAAVGRPVVSLQAGAEQPDVTARAGDATEAVRRALDLARRARSERGT